jgi:hypothetical protein
VAFLIADVDANDAPINGEQKIDLVLVQRPTGYCLKAVTSEGRVVGRWVSDCPLTASLTAMLWLGRHPWHVQQGKGSILVQQVIDEVQGIVPSQIHPQLAIEVLRKNFPEKPETSAVTGAQIALRPQGQIRTERQLPGPVQPAPVASAPVEEPPARKIERAHRRASVALTAGHPAGPVLRRLVSELGYDGKALPEAIDGLNDEQVLKIGRALIDQQRRLRAGDAEPQEIGDETVRFLGYPVEPEVPLVAEQLGDVDLGELDAELDALEAEVKADGAAELTAAAAPRVLRPLRPGEDPPNATPEQLAELDRITVDDPALRSKVQRTMERNQKEHDRVERELAAKREREQRRKAAGVTAAAAAVVGPAPTAPVAAPVAPVPPTPAPAPVEPEPDPALAGAPGNGAAPPPVRKTIGRPKKDRPAAMPES